MTISDNQKFSFGVSGVSHPPISILDSEKPPAFISPAAPKHSDGWEGNSFYLSGKKYVIAISQEISKNGLHEIRTYRYDEDKQAVPSGKLATIVTEPLIQRESTRTVGLPADNTKSTNKCLFCGKPVTWGNKKTKYCSDGCSTAAYRQRKEVVTV
jgi:hypothetical protein